MKRFWTRLVSLWRHTDKEVAAAEQTALAATPVTAENASTDAGFDTNTADAAAVDAGEQTAKHLSTRTCMNCDEVLTGSFCHECGQKVGDIRRPIWSLMAELLDNVVAPDSKLFKTILLLLAVPGGLTRDYNRGMRARFIPPLRFYITITFLFFALLFVTDVLILDIQFKYSERDITVGAEQGAEQGGEAGALDDIVAGWNNYEEEKEAGQGLENPTDPGLETPQPPGQAGQTAQSSTTQSLPAQPEDAVGEPKDSPAEGTADAGNQQAESPFKDATLKAILERLGERESVKSSELTEEEKEEFIAAMRVQLASLPPVAVEAIAAGVRSGNANVKLRGNPFNIDGDLNDDGVNFENGNLRIDKDRFPYEVSVEMFVKRSTEERDNIRPEDLESWVADGDMPQFVKDVIRGFADAIADPREFNDLFNDLLPKLLFFMVPFFALILRLFHWGKKRFYFNQLIFSLHFHSFLFLIFIGFIFVMPFFGGMSGLAIFWWGTSLYLVIALKIGQEQGWVRAFLKAGFIWVSYAVVLTLTLLGSSIVALSGKGLWDVVDLIRGSGV